MNPDLHSSNEANESPKSELPETASATVATSAQPEAAPKPRRPRGFAALDRSKVSEIASKGGKAAHAAGTAHQFSSDEARSAGRKGGVAPHVRRGRGPRQAQPSSSPTGTAKEGASE